MTAGDDTGEAPTPDSVELRIVEDERRRSGAFLRDYLVRHRIDTPAESTPIEPER